MFQNHKGDAALEWILVAAVGTLVFGAIVYNLSQTAGNLGNGTEGKVDTFSSYTAP